MHSPSDAPITPHGPEGDAPLAIDCVILGPFETNCYIVRVPTSRDCWIIDASFEPDELIATVRSKGLTPRLLVLTHAHVDHIAGITDVRWAFPAIQVLVHEAERSWLGDPIKNLSFLGGGSVTAPPADRTLAEGDKLVLGDGPGAVSFDVLHTPGHSPGGITLVCRAQRVAIVGDTLFAGSVGRSDFPGSDGRLLAESIRKKLYTLPPQTRVLPGHGPETTIGREMATNPFVRANG